MTSPGAAPDAAAPTIVVPSRPARATGVELLGEVEDSGFAERQWLVRRNGSFIQVTELLYRIAEQSDGTRDLDDIAAAVTEQTEWLVRKEDVARLVAARLMPTGIVAAPEGAAVTPPRVAPAAPLAITAKRRVIGSRVIDPVAGVLQYLFAPPILLPLLVLIGYAHWWLYTERGLMGALIDALFTPGFLLVVLGLVLISGIVHEFGHAAALRYGGGRARAMGVGLYLIFPAFYTDATDMYRLGRWGRVRTGLGGVYFHLLFALALIVAAIAFRLEFLLLVVVLVNIEVVRQFIPFARFDGYWVLTDLTGVPDLFSQMGAFARSLVGRRHGLPRLKRWVTAAFAAYTLVTIPVLALLLFLFMQRLPRIVTALWDAFATQTRFLRIAFDAGDLLALATSAAYMVVLGLAALGVAYLAYSLTWKPLRAAWRSRSRARRGAAVVAIAAVSAFLGVLWAPELPFARGAPPLGVQNFDVTERAHVTGRVAYPESPPIGGDHAPVWQNCGFYSSPVRTENAVHSLEHGAVWITYRPGLLAADVEHLRTLASEHTYVLVSPYPGLRSPVVASAWGRRLQLPSARDARLERFVQAYRLSRKAPEAGSPCTGGVGSPQ